MIGLGILALVVLVSGFFSKEFLGGMFGFYKIVPVNEAHVRIMHNKKETFSSRTGKSSYWVAPFITKLHKLPLTNLAIPINDIKLNDKNMAKFVCDITCFINIDNLDLAVERLPLTDTSKELGFDFTKLSTDLHAIVESVGRTSAAKQSILEVYMDRQAFDQAITKEVKEVFPKWGIALVDLELKEIKDAPNSTIVSDIETKVAAEIRRDATIKVAQTNKEAEVAKAENEEIYRKRQIQKDQAVSIAQQDAQIAVQQKTAEANIQQIEAKRKIEVGQAEIAKQITEQNAQASRIQVTQEAEAQKTKYATESEGQASQIMKVGQAEADIVRIKKEAEAAGTLKLAEAMKAFNDTAINVKILDIQKEVTIAKYNALGNALSKAEVKLIMSGEKSGSLFGMDFNADSGANLEQFLNQLGLDEAKVSSILSLIKK